VFDFLDVIGLPITVNDTSNMLALATMIPFAVFGVALLVELGFRRGTVGSNKYGPDPLTRT